VILQESVVTPEQSPNNKEMTQHLIREPESAEGAAADPEQVGAISTPSLSKMARLVSILGEFGQDELNGILTQVSAGGAAASGEPLSSVGQQPDEAISVSSGDDVQLAVERSADTPSTEAADDAGRPTAGIAGLGEHESSPVVQSNTAMIPALLAGLSHVQLSQIEKLVGLYQSEWQARAQQDQLNRELVLRGERQQAELDFQKERFAADQAKLEADLAHQQEVARLEARKESTGELVRSVVLFLVVLAVVLTPLLAMGWLKVPPQSFSQYVAPITGITGTVLGYWFGRQDPRK
jgi:hypothetical protein